MTTFTGVEALMNSRPLTCQSANPKDVTPLTPMVKQEDSQRLRPLMKNPLTRGKDGEEYRNFPVMEEVDKGMASVTEYASKMK